MGAGFYGLNGLHPAISLKLWHAYLIPRLTYGLEQTMCRDGDLLDVERFQRDTLRGIQHLPDQTSNVAFLLMMGELPIQATVDIQTSYSSPGYFPMQIPGRTT
jgi:hypothetical protein